MDIDIKDFALGDTVRDTVTGYEGVVTAAHQYLTGCARLSVQAKVTKDGAIPDPIGFDVTQLLLVKAGPRHVVNRTTGGPRNDPHHR